MPSCRGCCLGATNLPAAGAPAHRHDTADEAGGRATWEGARGEGRGGGGRRAQNPGGGPGEDAGAARGDCFCSWAWGSGHGEGSHGGGRRGNVTSRAREDPTWWSRRGDLGEHIDVSSGHCGGNAVDSAALVAGMHVNKRNKHSDRPRRGRGEVYVSTTHWWRWLWASGRLVFVLFFLQSFGTVGGSEGSAFGALDNDTHLGQASTIEMKSYPSRIDRCLFNARPSLHVHPPRKISSCVAPSDKF